MAENRSSVQWISENLALAGFTSETSCFMSCKEMLENSLDATRGSASASVILRLESVNEETVRISCSDNGVGFRGDSVNSISMMFESSRKDAGSVATTGKFGVGLKAVALTSHKECGGADLSITTRSSGNSGINEYVVFRMGYGEGGLVIKDVALEENSEYDSLGITTKVVGISPSPPDLNKLVKDIRDYGEELIRGTPNLTLSLSFPEKEEEVLTSLESVPRSVLHKDPSMLLHCIVSLSKKCTATPCSQIVLSRFVNGVPLVSQGGGVCAITDGILKALKKNCFSMGIELGPGSDITASSSVSSSALIATRPPASSWWTMHVRVFLQMPSCDVEYSSLTKSAVAGIKSGGSLAVIVQRCVKVSLRKLQNKFPGQFQSADDFERKMALEKYIPVIAVNLAEMAGRLRNTEVKNRLESLVGELGLEGQLKGELVKLLGEKKRGGLNSEEGLFE